MYESGGIPPCILNLDTRWRLSASGKGPRYTLIRLLVGLHRRSGHFGIEKNALHLPEIELRLFSRPARSLVTMLTELSRLIRYDVLLKHHHCGMLFFHMQYLKYHMHLVCKVGRCLSEHMSHGHMQCVKST